MGPIGIGVHMPPPRCLHECDEGSAAADGGIHGAIRSRSALSGRFGLEGELGRAPPSARACELVCRRSTEKESVCGTTAAEREGASAEGPSPQGHPEV